LSLIHSTLGGDNISATRGIVSRVEPTEYTPTFNLLAVQIDAAVNSGNSGGIKLFYLIVLDKKVKKNNIINLFF
jgi:hypothetical protein